MTTTTTTTTTITTASPPSSTLTSTPPILHGPVTATLNFYSPPTDSSPPYHYVEPPTPPLPQTNFSTAPHSIPISDIRHHEKSFSLATNAFAALTDIPSVLPPSSFTSPSADAAIRKTYYPEVTALLLTHVPGAHRVVIFDHTVRHADPAAARQPVLRVHIDQTAPSAATRVRMHAPSDMDVELALKQRYRIINVWRPINGVVESFPLGVADAQSVREEDLVPVEHRYPDRTGETAAVRYGAGQKWWYWSGMGDEERLLLQCFDSGDPGMRVPHTAFEDGRGGEGAKARESIEVRALVFG